MLKRERTIFGWLVPVLFLFVMNCKGMVQGPFTDHFIKWLQSAGYEGYDFPSLHLDANSSFGGRSHPSDRIRARPIVLIHGNSDGALDHGTEYSSGWTESIRYFLKGGYTPSELYALTWGDRNLKNSFARTHNCATLLRLRRFLEAVLRYTDAIEIDLIAHSMGVTLARRVIKGGKVEDDIEECDMGEPLNNRINTFVGIAGANFGLCLCSSEVAQMAPACGLKTGFWSGDSCDHTGLACPTAPGISQCDSKYADFLMELNQDSTKEAHFIASFYSQADEVIGSNQVWGQNTSVIPQSDDVLIFTNLRHHELKSKTVKQQYEIIAGRKSLSNV